MTNNAQTNPIRNFDVLLQRHAAMLGKLGATEAAEAVLGVAERWPEATRCGCALCVGELELLAREANSCLAPLGAQLHLPLQANQ